MDAPAEFGTVLLGWPVHKQRALGVRQHQVQNRLRERLAADPKLIAHLKQGRRSATASRLSSCRSARWRPACTAGHGERQRRLRGADPLDRRQRLPRGRIQARALPGDERGQTKRHRAGSANRQVTACAACEAGRRAVVIVAMAYQRWGARDPAAALSSHSGTAWSCDSRRTAVRGRRQRLLRMRQPR
jgi:hypothetical protein